MERHNNFKVGNMKMIFKNTIWLVLLLAVVGCSKKNEAYKELIKDGEITYPGVISNQNYRAGYLRTMLVWNPSPDPNIIRYKIYWNNKLDSLILNAESHTPKDTVKALISNLAEGTYNFTVYSIDKGGHISIPLTINGVRVYGAFYQSGIFNRGYNADTPFVVNFKAGSVKLKFNTPDSINLKTAVSYTDNSGKSITVNLRPDSNAITLYNYKFGTGVSFQSSYIPQKGAIDVFTVTNASAFPAITRTGDITALFISNPGNPFKRGDSGTGKWGLPKDWQYNSNVVNQDGGKGGGWSSDNNGVIHFESKDYSGAGITNGKVYQTITLPAGSYNLDFVTQGHGGDMDVNEVVAQGNTLPDIDKLSGNTLALFHGDNNSIDGTHTLSFTLARSTTVTIGWVVSTKSTTYLQFKNVALRIL
jgi:hypothetical protein